MAAVETTTTYTHTVHDFPSSRLQNTNLIQAVELLNRVYSLLTLRAGRIHLGRCSALLSVSQTVGLLLLSSLYKSVGCQIRWSLSPSGG